MVIGWIFAGNTSGRFVDIKSPHENVLTVESHHPRDTATARACLANRLHVKSMSLLKGGKTSIGSLRHVVHSEGSPAAEVGILYCTFVGSQVKNIPNFLLGHHCALSMNHEAVVGSLPELDAACHICDASCEVQESPTEKTFVGEDIASNHNQ